MRKAKFLKTGEAVNVHNIDYSGQGMDIALIEKDGLMKNVSLYDLQFIDSKDEQVNQFPINWEQRRYELAKAAMQGLLSNIVQGYTRDKPTLDIIEGVVENSIDCADKMLELLKSNTNE